MLYHLIATDSLGIRYRRFGPLPFLLEWARISRLCQHWAIYKSKNSWGQLFNSSADSSFLAQHNDPFWYNLGFCPKMGVKCRP